MGLTMSSEGYTIPQAVAEKLVELGDLFCTAGDDVRSVCEEVGYLLTSHLSGDWKLRKELCDSPDHILSLRNALLQTASSSRTFRDDLGVYVSTPTASPDCLWLQRFVSPLGEPLMEDRQAKLLRLFGRRTDGIDVKKLQADALDWCKNPSIFCETAPQIDTSGRSDLVGVYFDEYEWIEKNVPIRSRPRRRVILLETFLVIQKEEQCLRRAKVSQNKVSKQLASFRTRAVRSIEDRLWGGRFLPKEFNSRQERLMRMSRYGEKWSKIEPRGLLLGLAGESQE